MNFSVGSEQPAEVVVDLCWESDEQPISGIELRPHARSRGAVTWFYSRGQQPHDLIVGLGPEEGISADRVREAAGNAARAIHKEGFKTVTVRLDRLVKQLTSSARAKPAAGAPTSAAACEAADTPSGAAVRGAISSASTMPGSPAAASTTAEAVVTAWAEGWLLGSYTFDLYKSKKEARTVEQLHIVASAADSEDSAEERALEQAVKLAFIRAEGTMLARDLCNEPPNVLHPESLVERVEEHFAHRPVGIRIYRDEALEQLQMNGLLTVGLGSRYKPALIELTYATDPQLPLITLVGKGITFDMGGMNVKTGRDLSDARFDMGGACAVLGAMDIISRSGIPANVTALIATADNMPDANAFVPSTVISYPNGLTVQVGNTDAEGRLVLADALLHAGRLGAQEIIDIATLTGNVGQALGLKIAGAWGDRPFVEALAAIGEENGDRIWPMPLIDDYEELLHSDYADMNNMSPIPYGGAIVAALFLRRFVDKSARWVHIDMANTVQSKAAKGYYTAGATGYGARLLADFVSARARLAADTGSPEG
ncbi:hypothetical protein J2TS4_43710 [Paenibacillus sp. J2TS4]|nr:hypothetical protein J2TS4_43710 [Paenibacillus sp. J2TS4]